MKKLLIYYSLSGNGELVADKLSQRGYEIRRVYEKKKMPKSFFFMILAGGFRAGMKQKGKLIDYNNDVKEFDEIVIGSPIWNGQTPPAINSVLAQTDLKDKKLTFVFYSGSGDDPKVSKKIKKEYPNVDIVLLKEPKKYQNELEKTANLQLAFFVVVFI